MPAHLVRWFMLLQQSENFMLHKSPYLIVCTYEDIVNKSGTLNMYNVALVKKSSPIRFMVTNHTYLEALQI